VLDFSNNCVLCEGSVGVYFSFFVRLGVFMAFCCNTCFCCWSGIRRLSNIAAICTLLYSNFVKRIIGEILGTFFSYKDITLNKYRVMLSYNFLTFCMETAD